MGLDNGLAPNRRQVIIWTNVHPIHWCIYAALGGDELTHWGRVTHIGIGKQNIIGSDNGLSPRRRQAIIWTNAGILLIRPLGTNCSEILFRNQTFSFKKMHLKMSSAKWWPFCLGLNELINGTQRIVSTSVKIHMLSLTHWGRVRHIYISELTVIGSDNGLVPSRLKQCWIIVNWTLRNKHQWNFNRNSIIFIHENALEHVVCEMASILSRPQCVEEKKKMLLQLSTHSWRRWVTIP